MVDLREVVEGRYLLSPVTMAALHVYVLWWTSTQERWGGDQCVCMCACCSEWMRERGGEVGAVVHVCCGSH